jgi:hypothetical protein
LKTGDFEYSYKIPTTKTPPTTTTIAIKKPPAPAPAPDNIKDDILKEEVETKILVPNKDSDTDFQPETTICEDEISSLKEDSDESDDDDINRYV